MRFLNVVKEFSPNFVKQFEKKIIENTKIEIKMKYNVIVKKRKTAKTKQYRNQRLSNMTPPKTADEPGFVLKDNQFLIHIMVPIIAIQAFNEFFCCIIFIYKTHCITNTIRQHYLSYFYFLTLYM